MTRPYTVLRMSRPFLGAEQAAAGGGPLSHALLTADANTTDQQQYTTASISPGGNKLILAAVSNYRAAGTPGTITLSGNGLTWVEIRSLNTPGNLNKLALFRAMGASPTPGVVTIDITGTTNGGCAWAISEWSNANTGGTHGSAAIVQSAENSTTGGDPNVLVVTLATLADAANNAVFSAFMSDDGPADGALTQKTGYTEVAEVGGTGGEDFSVETNYKIPGDTTPEITCATAFFDLAGIAVEIDQA